MRYFIAIDRRWAGTLMNGLDEYFGVDSEGLFHMYETTCYYLYWRSHCDWTGRPGNMDLIVDELLYAADLHPVPRHLLVTPWETLYRHMQACLATIRNHRPIAAIEPHTDEHCNLIGFVITVVMEKTAIAAY
jgi:hypothetical protein